MIWTIKHKPKREPKFHQAEIFTGAGRSTNALFTILKRGCSSRKGLFISYVIGRKGPLKMFVILTVAIKVIKR